MSGVLTISVDTRKVENMLNGYSREFPKLENIVPRKIAGAYAAAYIQAQWRAGIRPWTGESTISLLSQKTNPVKLGKGSYGVIVPHYSVMLDSMKPHWVSLRRGRSITRWAKDKLGVEGMPGTSVFVRPHPWIRRGNISGAKNVRTIAENEVNKVIRRKGR